MNKRLSGKTVFLTGACGGLGTAVAVTLLQHKTNLVISDENPKMLSKMRDALVKKGLPEPVVYPMNLTSSTSADYLRLARLLEKDFGRLDALIHCAATFSGLTPFLLYETSRWLQEMQVNVNSPVFLTQALLPLLLRTRGTIIFTLDDLESTSTAYWGQYGVGKAAIWHFAKALRQECEHQGVKVKTITPPPMLTKLRKKAWPNENPDKLVKPSRIALNYLEALLEK